MTSHPLSSQNLSQLATPIRNPKQLERLKKKKESDKLKSLRKRARPISTMIPPAHSVDCCNTKQSTSNPNSSSSSSSKRNSRNLTGKSERETLEMLLKMGRRERRSLVMPQIPTPPPPLLLLPSWTPSLYRIFCPEKNCPILLRELIAKCLYP